MLSFSINRSDRKNKKLKIQLYRNNKKIKTIHIGASGHGDYPYYYNKYGRIFANKKKGQYIARHRKRENWADPLTAGFWARWILWHKQTIYDSIIDIIKTKNINYKN